MTKQQLLELVTKKYHEQLQREYHYQQSIRDGLIERCPSTRFTISEKD